MRSFLFLFASWLVWSARARLHSLPDDPHAFPKFTVSFLNGHPLLNKTAEQWLNNGLTGGEDEFLDQPWHVDGHRVSSQRKEIGTGDTSSDTHTPIDTNSFSSANYTLQHLRMGPKDSYLCLIPKPSESTSSRQQEEPESDPTPAKTWSLLQSLSGTCLYHRQGWFTYSYCHNREIRQFKELAQPQARIPGTYRPEEDPEWESYTLGRAPRSSEEPGADLTVAERNAQAANLELARNAGSRYLVQRWGDGTVCDKTGKPREVEVQFHCSMVMTDHILFVKETKTCSYVLVIHTPRLCGEPGFKSRRDAVEETLIRCREVVDTLPQPADTNSPWPKLPSGDTPMKLPKRKPVLPSPPPGVSSSGSSHGSVSRGKPEKAKSGSGDSSSTGSSAASIDNSGKTKEQLYSELVEKTLELLINNADGAVPGVGAITGANRKGAKAVVTEEGDIIVEYLDDEDEDGGTEASQRIADALKAAGYDVRTEVVELRENTDATTTSSRKGSKNSKEPKSRKSGKKWNFGRFEL